MKPVTEDQVQTLLAGLERREKEALKTLAEETDTYPLAGGRVTARVLRFTKSRPNIAEYRDVIGDDVVPFEAQRVARRSRRTSKGLFFYSAGDRSAKSSV